MIKLIKLLIVPVTLVLTIVSIYSNKEIGFNDPNIYVDSPQLELLSGIQEKNIFLYGIRNDNNYEKVLLKIGDKEKTFDWSNTLNLIGYPPRLILTDLNNDGKKELVIVMTEAYGTGIHISSIHILNKDTLEELPIDNPTDIAEKNIKAKLTTNCLTLSIKDKVYRIKIINFIDDTSNLWYDVPIGKQVYYSVEGNNIVARLSVHIKPVVSVGNIKIIYEYKNNKLQVSDIDFEPSKP